MPMAEAMIFRSDGNLRTTAGWVAHEPDNLQHAQNYTNTKSGQTKSGDRNRVLRAIEITAARYAHKEILQRLSLSSPNWHYLFRALIEAESLYRSDAVSAKGAVGLGQLMPATARALDVDPKDPEQNLDGSARYLLTQLRRFRDIDLALAAYNAGPTRIRTYGQVPPFPETRRYIARIHRIRARLALSGLELLRPLSPQQRPSIPRVTTVEQRH
ncbi:hypothetical protein KIN_43530 [Litoreibacter roseus]|uniref:Transglycosylase SLT domain-containing protein n=2 Tax=Litoreibacter roseus TaxID=2601869 RepID=A0A6N6JNT2_9RHOB|nr:hypothetical protein KIN_43530 [Litoreibacter roseus]